MRWLRWKRLKESPQVVKDLQSLENRIGYRFGSPSLLIKSLKHRSYLDVSGEQRRHSNERLEFLGDAVLGLIVSEHFYRTHEGEDEGTLTGAKSTIVSGSVLAEQAKELDLGYYLLLSDNEERSGGRDRDSILEDAFEALIGAIYLDGGLPPAKRFVKKFLLAASENILTEESLQNYKSTLQEYVQGRGDEPPDYRVVEESGPDHDKLFKVEVHINGEFIGSGHGRTKKEAEQRAAAAGIVNIRSKNTQQS